MANRRQQIVFGLAAIVAGLVMFLVASAFIVARGYSHWLAAAVGAFAFPVAPLTWQVVGEVRRKKKLSVAKAAPKTTLTSSDRFMLRLFVVALLVLGPMFAVGKLGVFKAVWKHGLWWWPTSYEPTTSHGSVLSMIGAGVPRTIDAYGTPLARVPADAELVLSFDAGDDGRGVMAWGNRQLLITAEGKTLDKGPEDKLAELNKNRDKMPWLATDELVEVKNTDSVYVAATKEWKYKVDPPSTGPSADILRELGRAPKGALFALGFVPKTTAERLAIRAGAGWLRKDGDKLIAEGRIETTSEAAAKKLVDEMTSELDRSVDKVPQSCKEEVGKLIRMIRLDQTGAIVTGRLEVEGGELVGVAFCSLKDRK